MSLRHIAFLVRGEVQGVNFRAWTAKQAGQLNVTGWVSNTSDGHVKGEALGDKASVDKFVGLLGQGPSIANVTGVELEKDGEVEDPKKVGWTLSKFEVRH